MPQRLELERQLYASPNILFHFLKALLATPFWFPLLFIHRMEKVKKFSPNPKNKTQGNSLRLFSLFELPPQARPGLDCPRPLSPPACGSREKVGRRSERLFPRCVCTCARSRLPGAWAGDRNCSGHRQSDGAALGACRAGGGRGRERRATHPGLTRPRPSPAVSILLLENR